MVDGASDRRIDGGDAFGGGRIRSLDEGDDVADLSFDVGAVAVFFRGGATKDRGSTLELAEGFADGFIATAENPVNHFALGHLVEIVNGEEVVMNHGADNIGEELEGGSALVAAVDGEERKAGLSELFGDGEVVKTEFVEALFVFEDGEVLVEASDLVESPGVKKEETVTKGVF